MKTVVVIVHTDTQIPSLLITTERANRWMFYFKDEKGTFKTARRHSQPKERRNELKNSSSSDLDLVSTVRTFGYLTDDDAEVVVT